MKKIFNTILIIFLILIELTTILFITAKLTIKKDNINKIINTTSENILTDEKTLNNISTKISNETNIDKNIIESAIKSETAKEIITDITSNIIDYNLGKTDKIDTDKIINKIEDNIDTIAKESGYKITEKEKEDLIKELETNKNKIIESIGEKND